MVRVCGEMSLYIIKSSQLQANTECKFTLTFSLPASSWHTVRVILKVVNKWQIMRETQNSVSAFKMRYGDKCEAKGVQMKNKSLGVMNLINNANFLLNVVN